MLCQYSYLMIINQVMLMIELIKSRQTKNIISIPRKKFLNNLICVFNSAVLVWPLKKIVNYQILDIVIDKLFGHT